MKIGYHAAHEQFSPRNLLDYVVQAEQAGFQGIMSSDHLVPWSVRQGQSGFCWSWLGAALHATSLPFGSLAIPGGWRYHPVIVAQAAATLAQMFPERFPWIAAGSGEAMNERVVGQPWPSKQERNERLETAVAMMRSLWAGKTVTEKNDFLPIHQGKLWTLPEEPPKIYAAALSEKTAAWAGSWADGLITVRKQTDELKRMITAFHDGGGRGKPLILQMQLSWAATDDEARHNAWDQWRSTVLDLDMCEDLYLPEQFDAASESARPEDMDRHILISSDPARHAAWIDEYSDLGFDEIYLHNVGRNQKEFIDVFGKSVLPYLKRSVPS